MALIFDVKVYKAGEKSFTDYGYSIFPLFEHLQDDEGRLEVYVNSGIYSVS